MDINNLKKVPGFNDYYVDEEGRVYSIKIKELTPTKTQDGYYQYHFCENNIHKYPRAHRIIAQTFIPNPDNLPVVNHKDGNKLNNEVSNLEWVTYSENSIHSVEILGNRPPVTNEKRVVSKNLDTLEVIEFDSMSECARFYEVTHGSIYRKINEKSCNPATKGNIKNIMFELLE